MEPAPPSRFSANPALEETLSCHEGQSPEAPPSASVPWALPRGTSIHRYIILDRLGQGGMGVVYAAHDPSLDRRVALKFLAPHDADRHGVREKRLLREAQAMGRLSHPNVVVAFDVGTYQGHVFLAMEFVDGVDLRTWLAEKPRSFSQIMDLFRAAGRGLAAAHAAGIIHRDFKPENVLLDKHERPRVTDFGLSRATHDPEEQEAEPAAEDRTTFLSTPSHLSSPLTYTGSVLGTPSYMPPEQRAGGAVDARSDQFSFCVALYEALYGEHPFPGNPSERAANAVAGRVAPAPAYSSVPKWCRQALLRGLNPAPENRFTSMEGLLVALSPHPMSRRRRVMTAASLAVILAGVGTYGLFLDRRDSPGPRCDLGNRHLSDVWDEARKHELRDAFQRSGARGADVTWKSFSTILDQRARAWAEMHNETCAATHLDGSQSPAVLDLRMECLDHKRQEMKALVDVYSDEPDARSLDQAIAAVDKLSSISSCADVANLRAVVPLPEDPAARGKVQALRRRLSHGRALYDSGRYQQGREYMESLRQETGPVGYAPLDAEVAHTLGTYLMSADQYEESEKLLLDAARQAVNGRDWRLEADILVTLLELYARARRVPEGHLLARQAELAIERANGDDTLRARLADSIGRVERRVTQRTGEALRQFQRAEKLWMKSPAANSPRFAATLSTEGAVLAWLGKPREAVDHAERALALQRRILRPDHPDIAVSLAAVGNAQLDLGQFQEMRDTFQNALAINKQELGPEHSYTISSLLDVGLAEAYLGNFDLAFEFLGDAVSIQKSDSPELIRTYIYLGEAQRFAGLNHEAERTLEQVVELNVRMRRPPDHFSTGAALKLLGLVHNRLGLHRRALRECRRALDIVSPSVGQHSITLIETRECIGEALIATGDFDGARRELEPALTSITQSDFGAQWTAGARLQLARAFWATPSERPRARELARTTLNELSAAEGDNHKMMARIEAWLKTHGESQTRGNQALRRGLNHPGFPGGSSR